MRGMCPLSCKEAKTVPKNLVKILKSSKKMYAYCANMCGDKR